MSLFSLGIILLLGFLGGQLFKKMKLPKIIGMIITGILIGPSVLNIINSSIINISSMLRQIALVIILTRAGLSLDLKKLKKVGWPAFLMCFIPATFEIICVLIFGPILLKISILESLLLGSVLAAVSPAILVPRMIRLKSLGYGNNKNIPELLMAGASIDDIYVIILFYAFLGLVEKNSLSFISFLNIPVSIIIGVLFGILFGLLISKLFKVFKINLINKILILLSFSFLLIGFEELIKEIISFSSLLSIVTVSMVILFKDNNDALKIELGYQKIWAFFEILLFVLVGISVDLNYAISAGFMPILLILMALIFRSIGVYLAISFTNLNFKEKLFVILSYLPKATVQASIGGIALSRGLEVGSLVLTVAVLSILITAPLGAILIDKTSEKLLYLE